MLVHPAYDPTTRSWFVPDMPEYEAPTLRALAKVMGPQVKFKDYYPRGVSPEVLDVFIEKSLRLGMRDTQMRPNKPRSLGFRERSKSPSPAKPRYSIELSTTSHRKAHDRELVLNLWAQGLISRVISYQVPTHPSDAVVRTIVQAARRKGDRRATKRYNHGSDRITPRGDHHAQ